MRLQEFVQQTKAELDKMEKHWLAQQEVQPENYPLEMSIGDWYEQFMFFTEQA